MRPQICAANWKMNKTPEEALAFVQEFLQSDFKSKSQNVEMMIFPNALSWQVLAQTSKDIAGKVNFRWGLQNIHAAENGAYTGETSASMAASINAGVGLVGHSERRQLFSETDEETGLKVEALQGVGITPMLCVGESLGEREAGKTMDVVHRQVEAGLSRADLKREIVIAYEPVWAIGTGKVATPEQAEEVHLSLRNKLADIAGVDVAEKTAILYGGSVKPANAAELLQKENIDGFLVGGASLKTDSWISVLDVFIDS